MELLHLSENMDYSETCFRSDKHRSRFCMEELQRSNGMDSQQDGVFQRITKRFYTQKVDLFVSRLNNQLPRYVVRYPDPGSVEGVHTCSNSAPASDSAETTTG